MNTLDGVVNTRIPGGGFRSRNLANDGQGRVVDGPHRRILAEHRPNGSGTSCMTCGFVYSEDRPLCPALAGTLRELATGTHRPTSSPLGRHSTAQLRKLVHEHTGDGRCRRCGFTYAEGVQKCPTARRIEAVLAGRDEAFASAPRSDQGLCAGAGDGWGVSGNDPAPWRQAMKACAACPLLAQCEQSLQERLDAGQKIREQIMAGRLFTVRGHEIKADQVDKFAIARGRRKTTLKTGASLSPATTLSTYTGTQPHAQLPLFEGVAA